MANGKPKKVGRPTIGAPLYPSVVHRARPRQSAGRRGRQSDSETAGITRRRNHMVRNALVEVISGLPDRKLPTDDLILASQVVRPQREMAQKNF